MNFKLNDLVDVRGRDDLTNYGRILEFLPDNKARVHFVTPNQPKWPRLCDGCGFGSGLSKNVGSGEIVCMGTGCGHNHGFKEWDEEVSLDLLVLAPTSSAAVPA